ncbi:lipase 3-like isoform X2 [Temnothorax americanus]|uniref:lipase 3-like isoform X2 n=1 Tax=Temnothorax americanus TaxID=1964332 RepID=UPI00406837DE
MMTSIKFMLVAFLIIMTFSEGRSQSISSLFLQNDMLNFFFPKDTGLVRVRRIDPAEKINSEKILDFIGLVEQYNYPAEEHSVTTEDGYNLKIHRIPGSPLLSNSKTKKEIVFVQHGLLVSSDSWVLYGPGKDLAFLLADQGYDVWIGNMRGNNYCRSHVNMTTYDPKFWQYSFHEIGTKDLPAMFDYILNYTKQKDLYYIGHSMGNAVLLTLLSSKPEYNIKIKMVICLAPTSFWVKTSPAVNEFANILPTFKEVLRKREIYDVFPQSLATVTVGRTLCNDNTMTQFICVTILFIIAGPDSAQLNITTLPDIFSYFPAGSSVQTLEHFYQNIRTKDFRNYDYGIAENYKRYKQETPPSYDLKMITAPIILFYSANDVIVLEENVLELGKHLPNVLLTEEVPFKLFNHFDFMWAINAKTLLYDRVLELLQKFNAD